MFSEFISGPLFRHAEKEQRGRTGCTAASQPGAAGRRARINSLTTLLGERKHVALATAVGTVAVAAAALLLWSRQRTTAVQASQ